MMKLLDFILKAYRTRHETTSATLDRTQDHMEATLNHLQRENTRLYERNELLSSKILLLEEEKEQLELEYRSQLADMEDLADSLIKQVADLKREIHKLRAALDAQE